MTTSSSKTKTNKQRTRGVPVPLVISTGCPRGIGPEVAVRSVFELFGPQPSERCVILVGDRGVLAAAARAAGLADDWIKQAPAWLQQQITPGVFLSDPEHGLSTARAKWGKPDQADGRAQLEYVERGFRLAKKLGAPLITGPVSKEAIAHCGLARAKRFRGHTEWLEEMDGAAHSVMCFQSAQLTCSLVTTHVPIAKLPRLLSAEGVRRSTVELVQLLWGLGVKKPRVAVCSLNPHAGEGELLGTEEKSAIVPGIALAQSELGKKANLIGPVGAETAFRKAAAGHFDGVVAMYHDQATIPMKVLAFGEAVNVTQGLSIVRTSVDHGTGYDIAGRGIADAQGMRSALALADRLTATRRA